MATDGKLPEELEQFLKEVEDNISLYPETIVYNRIKGHLINLSTKRTAWLTSAIIVTPEFRARIFKIRCDAGDKLACEMLDLAVNGDPYSKRETVRKGLIGLWQDENDAEAGKLLLELGRITQEEFNKSARAGKDQETINGKTRETLLCELAAEAKKFPTADAFSMAMIMRELPGLDTNKVYKIIEGKYNSADDFWNAVKKGEVCTEMPEKKESPPPPPKEKEIPKPEAVTAVPVIIPTPKIEGGELPRLDIMKAVIENRIKMIDDAVKGLINLGFKKRESQAVVQAVAQETKDLTTEALIKAALLKLRGERGLSAGEGEEEYPKSEKELQDYINKSNDPDELREFYNQIEIKLLDTKNEDSVRYMESTKKKITERLLQLEGGGTVREGGHEQFIAGFRTCQDYKEFELKCKGCNFKTTVVKCVYSAAMR